MWPFRKKKTPDTDEDILNEIETLFDKMKDSDLSLSNIVEHNELVCSNLLLAYYLAKLERRLGNE